MPEAVEDVPAVAGVGAGGSDAAQVVLVGEDSAVPAIGDQPDCAAEVEFQVLARPGEAL